MFWDIVLNKYSTFLCLWECVWVNGFERKYVFAEDLPDHGLNQWLRWEGIANPGSSGAGNAPKWLESVEPETTPTHPH